MTDDIQRIHKTISSIYDGQAWHGDNIVTQLSGVTAAMACSKPKQLNHSIAEIVCHMTAWRYFVVEKLRGNADYEVWDTELNWKNIERLTDEKWEEIKNDLKASQAALLDEIAKMPESLLAKVVDGRKYNFRLMLNGIANHDVHHTGQISIIKKLVG